MEKYVYIHLVYQNPSCSIESHVQDYFRSVWYLISYLEIIEKTKETEYDLDLKNLSLENYLDLASTNKMCQEKEHFHWGVQILSEIDDGV